LSSRYENLPCVLIESLACGTPVIATNVGGVAEIVHNKNGILVQSESLPELTEALRAIQSMQFDGEGLRSEAIEKYGPTNIAQLFLEAYQMVLTKDVA
jgi:glycosyltransferase involved in cell wall biosynthesis